MLAEFVGFVSAETWETYQEAHKECCGVCEAVSDLEKFRLLCKHIAEKRVRRAECLNDPAKRDAAIDAKKKRVAGSGRKRKGFAGYMPVSRKAKVVPGANAAETSSHGSDSDQESDY